MLATDHGLLGFRFLVPLLWRAILRVLIELRKKSEAIKGRVAIAGLRPDLRKVFKVARIERPFEFYDDEDAALNGFGAHTDP